MFNDVVRWVNNNLDRVTMTTFAMTTKYTLVGNAYSGCITSDSNDITACGVNWSMGVFVTVIPLATGVS